MTQKEIDSIDVGDIIIFDGEQMPVIGFENEKIVVRRLGSLWNRAYLDPEHHLLNDLYSLKKPKSENEILKERITFLENRVNYLQQWIAAYLQPYESEIGDWHSKMTVQWQNHPDGDFDKTLSTKLFTVTDTEYRDNHISKKPLPTLDELFEKWRFTNEWKACKDCTSFREFIEDKKIPYRE